MLFDKTPIKQLYIRISKKKETPNEQTSFILINKKMLSMSSNELLRREKENGDIQGEKLRNL